MIKKRGYNHTYGHCIVSDKYELIYILIPKNASCLFRAYMKKII